MVWVAAEFRNVGGCSGGGRCDDDGGGGGAGDGDISSAGTGAGLVAKAARRLRWPLRKAPAATHWLPVAAQVQREAEGERVEPPATTAVDGGDQPWPLPLRWRHGSGGGGDHLLRGSGEAAGAAASEEGAHVHEAAPMGQQWHPMLSSSDCVPGAGSSSMPSSNAGGVSVDDSQLRSLDDIPLDEDDVALLSAVPRAQARAEVGACEPSVCSSGTCGDSGGALDEPPRMPRLPFASRLAEGTPFQRCGFPNFTPKCAGGSSSSSSSGGATGEWNGSEGTRDKGEGGRASKTLPPFSLQDLERTIQKVDYGRLEARLFQDDEEGAVGSPQTWRAVTRDKDPDMATCNSEEQQLVDSPRRGDVCGGGCRLMKMSHSRQRDPDDDVVGGLHAFLHGADDDTLDYILGPAGKSHCGWHTAL
mmetsp:Transcript_68017/g.191708  ORF Transcript_68017/g.191708 Transcript_68017/m.191708 type:complete len:417 (+) Transcript_68017:117-1367(+)